MRGDCGYGNEVLLGECEARALPCFFKLRHTAKVKTLRAQMQRAGAAWTAAGEGWEVREARLRLSGWSRERRVVLVRETPARARRRARAASSRHLRARAARRRGLEPKPRGSPTHQPPCSPPPPRPWAGRIAVLVTTLEAAAYPAVALARLYRERADAEPSGAR